MKNVNEFNKNGLLKFVLQKMLNRNSTVSPQSFGEYETKFPWIVTVYSTNYVAVSNFVE